MVINYKGLEATLYGAKSLEVKKDGKVIFQTSHRTVETLVQVHELLEVLADNDG